MDFEQTDAFRESVLFGDTQTRIVGKIWAFDSEFLLSKDGHAGDVLTIQFSDGEGLELDNEHNFVLFNAKELRKFLHNHRRTLKIVYAFSALCDIGSLQEWLGYDAVRAHKRGIQHTATVKCHGAKFRIVDAHPLLKSFGFHRLGDCGAHLGIPKLDKPTYLGKRAWKPEEKDYFVAYALRDAVITSRIVRWMRENLNNADPAELVSSGSLAKRFFAFPKRLTRKKKTVLLTTFEANVQLNTFAGRSEGFMTGVKDGVFYNDVGSLYPCSMVAMRAMNIRSFKKCNVADLDLTGDLKITEDDKCHYGWVEGFFETHNDLWSLPVRGNRNFYMTGKVYGLFNTFDIGAAKAKPLYINRAWMPTFRTDQARHKFFAKWLLKRLNNEVTDVQKRFIKAVWNSSSGKLGQRKPMPATTSNFLAYNLLLGHSHLIMSKAFDLSIAMGGKPLAMDTDSIFSTVPMTKKMFDVSDGEISVPVNMDVKGINFDDEISAGRLAFFRSKRYILWDTSRDEVFGKNPCFGRHGWRYPREDFIPLFHGKIDSLTTRVDIKHTLMTQVKAAKELILGHWRTEVKTLDLAKIKLLLTADNKRNRGAKENYDSYQLVRDGRSIYSKAWDFNDYYDRGLDKDDGSLPDEADCDFLGLRRLRWSGI